jgi:hypothetical protein
MGKRTNSMFLVEVSAMRYYRCSCGFRTEQTPRLGDTLISVYHLHHATRLDGSSSIVRMEEVSFPSPPCETPLQPEEAAAAV